MDKSCNNNHTALMLPSRLHFCMQSDNNDPVMETRLLCTNRINKPKAYLHKQILKILAASVLASAETQMAK